jgi:hypothetical protein
MSFSLVVIIGNVAECGELVSQKKIKKTCFIAELDITRD